MNYGHLDRQLAQFSDQLVARASLNTEEARKVGTSIAAETRFLEPNARSSIFAASPVPLQERINELSALQTFMKTAARIQNDPSVTRAHVVVQNYISFVYLGEVCFRALLKASQPGSVTRRCCKFLTDNPARAFRNALAHVSWTYKPDFRGLVFWSRKGSDPNEALTRFEVSQSELDFWQMLSKTVGYAAYTSIQAAESDMSNRS